MESIGERIVRLRNSKGWSRPELGRQMAKVTGRAKPFSGELVRRYEEGIDRPSRTARAALAKAFDRTESYIEFGDAPQHETKMRQPASPAYPGVSDEALEIARAFDQMQPQAREFIREQVFIYTVIDKSFPWLRHGRPMGKTYDEFERWHSHNITASRTLEAQRATATTSSPDEPRARRARRRRS